MPNALCYLALLDVSLSTEVNRRYPTSTTKLVLWVRFWFGTKIRWDLLNTSLLFILVKKQKRYCP